MKRVSVAVLMIVSIFSYAQKSKKTIKKPKIRKVISIQEKKDEEEPPGDTPSFKNETLEVTKSYIEEKEEVKDSSNQDISIDKTIEKVSKEKGWLKNRNSVYVRGMEVFIKGTYVDKERIYILIEVYNRTNINYDIESVSFVTTPVKRKEKQLIQEEKIFIPIEKQEPDMVVKKTSVKMIYAFDKFTISDDVNLIFTMDEANGDRTIALPIKSNYIIKSQYIK